jgi:hypothetical protein
MLSEMECNVSHTVASSNNFNALAIRALDAKRTYRDKAPLTGTSMFSSYHYRCSFFIPPYAHITSD